MTRRHWLYLVGAVVLLAGVLVWAFRPQPVPVEAAEVRSGRFELAIEEDGKTRVRERYVVSAPLAGRLARITLKAGDAVKAGMPVATLWPSAPAMIDARTFRELNERVGAAEAGWQQARANVAREEAALEKAQTDLARQQKLQEEGFVSPSALDQAQLSVRVQAKALEAARFARDGAAHDVAQARAALMRAQEGAAIKRPGSAWPIVSPVDGRVLRVLQESESVVALGAPLVEVADPRDLEVVIDVLSTEGARIADGARVELDAGAGLRLQGRVRRVEPAAFTKVSALGVEEQRVNVIVDLVTPAEQWQGGGALSCTRRVRRGLGRVRDSRHASRAARGQDRRPRAVAGLGVERAGGGRAGHRLPQRPPDRRRTHQGRPRARETLTHSPVPARHRAERSPGCALPLRCRFSARQRPATAGAVRYIFRSVGRARRSR